MSAEPLPSIVEELPVSLRHRENKWEILCAGRDPLIVSTGAPPDTLDTVRRALDQKKILNFKLVPNTTNHVLSIREKLPADLPKEIIDAAPEMPASVSAKVVGDLIPKDPAQYTTDRVLWVTPILAKRVLRFTFEKQAAPCYLADVHPRKSDILAAAAASIQEGHPVRVATSGIFLLDLLPAAASRR